MKTTQMCSHDWDGCQGILLLRSFGLVSYHGYHVHAVVYNPTQHGSVIQLIPSADRKRQKHRQQTEGDGDGERERDTERDRHTRERQRQRQGETETETQTQKFECMQWCITQLGMVL